MDEDLVEAAHAYASRHALGVRERLGSGIHGIVHVVESKTEPGRRALKLHRDSDSYLREKTVYERLSEKRVNKILGFKVPVPLRFDDELMAIEMTIVMPPFYWISRAQVWTFRWSFQKKFGPIGRAQSRSNSAQIGKRFWRS
jgi:hypothetical protein